MQYWKNISLLPWLCLIAILIWGACLPCGVDTSTALIPVNLAMVAAAVYAWKKNLNRKNGMTVRQKFILASAALVFSFSTVIVNYPLWCETLPGFSGIATYILLPVAFCGGFQAAFQCLRFAFDIHDHFTLSETEVSDRDAVRLSPAALFLLCFLSTSAIYLFFLFAAFYPGCYSPDSISQLTQIQTGEYTNFHPFYHTLLVKMIVTPAYNISGSMNHAAASFCVFQILCMAAVFSYVTVTLYQKKAAPRIVAVTALFFALYPINIMFSFTLWKDVLFGCMILLFITAAYRIMFRAAKTPVPDYCLLLIGGLGFCLFRTNGMLIFIPATVIFALMFWKKYRYMTLVMAAVTAVCLPLQLAAFSRFPSADFVEPLSIPIQQVARVVSGDYPLTENEERLLREAVDLERVPVEYDENISDPMKELIRNKGLPSHVKYMYHERWGKGGQPYMVAHKPEYVQLWLDLGKRYPGCYAEAWIEQTKGYWYGSFQRAACIAYIRENDLGIEPAPRCGILKGIYTFFVWNMNGPWSILTLLMAAGLAFWVYCGIFSVAMTKKWKECMFLTLPFIIMILLLLIGTPVFYEFRYAYSLFISLPVILFAFMNMPRETAADPQKNDTADTDK